MSISQNRKPLYFTQSYSAHKCITKCPNCYNCKGHGKDNIQNQTFFKDPFLMEYQNGIYQGDFSNLSKENMGVFISDDSLFYLGSWKSDQISGLGYLFFPKGGFLYARFEKNKINGVGVLNYPNGNRLLGYWKRSKMHGPFMHYFANKKLWVQCEYIEGLLMRYGKEEFSEEIPEILREYPEMRKTIETLVTDDYLKGFKMPEPSEEELKFFKLSKDLKYIGFAKKKTPHGLGLVFHEHNPLFYGLFKEGVLDGFGRMNLENGDIYEGMFKDGGFNGIGAYYNKKNDNYIYGSFMRNTCINKEKVGSKYPLSLIMNFKKEEHIKNTKFFNKNFNFSVLSLGPEFSDENFLEESQKSSSSSLSKIYTFPIEKEKKLKKPLENIEVVQKSSSKDIQKTQIIEAKTHLTPQTRIFNEIELFQDIIHGKYYQFPRNCLDFYDNNIDSYEVISQNNNIYNLAGNIKRVLRRNKQQKSQNLILQFETFEDKFKVCKEENFLEKKLQLTPKPSNFLEKTYRKEEALVRTIRKSEVDKENLYTLDKKDTNPIIFLKKSGNQGKMIARTKNYLENENHFNVSQNEYSENLKDALLKNSGNQGKMMTRTKNYLENENHFNVSHNESSENVKDVSRISSIRITEKMEKSPDKSRFLQMKRNEDLNTNELNNLSEQVYLKMSKNRGIFDVSEDIDGRFSQEMIAHGQKFKGNESFRSSYSFVDRNKERNRSQNPIFKDLKDEVMDVDRSF